MTFSAKDPAYEQRILDPTYFVLGTLPKVRLRADGGESLPHFGPRAAS